jgi:hypothetical protein
MTLSYISKRVAVFVCNAHHPVDGREFTQDDGNFNTKNGFRTIFYYHYWGINEI